MSYLSTLFGFLNWQSVNVTRAATPSFCRAFSASWSSCSRVSVGRDASQHDQDRRGGGGAGGHKVRPPFFRSCRTSSASSIAKTMAYRTLTQKPRKSPNRFPRGAYIARRECVTMTCCRLVCSRGANMQPNPSASDGKAPIRPFYSCPDCKTLTMQFFKLIAATANTPERVRSFICSRCGRSWQM